MTNKEAILVLKSTLVNLGRRGGKTAYAEALEMAITALQVQDKLQDIEYMCRLSGGADYFRVFAALIEETNKNEQLNNLNDGVENANSNSTNEIKSRVKGMTACRVPEDDCISRQAAIDALHRYFDGMLETDTWSPCDVYGLIEILPSAQPDWNEMIVICDCCGHAIHVKRQQGGNNG